ncbi:MAG: DUF3990 domain-containing protein [Dysgonamonadaceae bacterium]|jgi:hypothetical protein|nr:DUF3990 domain-containing protein [Dysgonamonadaceae bacterium]
MKVYHGSYMEIDRIDLSQCKPRKDFGRGFYVTKFFEQAEFWAYVYQQLLQELGIKH